MGRLEFNTRVPAAEAKPVRQISRQGPLHILVMGDFSGRNNRGVLEVGADLAERPLVPIDIDRFDQVLYNFSPRLRLPPDPANAAPIELEFRCLDDFHPDRLHEKLELFRKFRAIRRRVLDPSTFEEAAADLKPTGDIAFRPTVKDADAPVEDPGATLERLLGKRPVDAPEARVASQGRADIDELVRRLVEPYIERDVSAQQNQLVAAVDEATADQMRRLLHAGPVRALESLWRALHWLVSNLEDGEDLKISLLDVTKGELASDLEAALEDPASSGMHKLLVDRFVGVPGQTPPSILIGDYAFGPSATDVGLLARMASLSDHLGAPFLAAADSSLIGVPSIADSPDPSSWSPDPNSTAAWQALRQSPTARWIGLTLPRFLLRLPYGKRSDAIERFDFEEVSGDGAHSLLWGNPAFGCALLIGKAFEQRSWEMQPGDFLDLEDLPFHTYEEGGERKASPSAEAFLGDRAAGAILEIGVMPLLSYADRNAARLARFQSIADPPRALAGPWA